MTTVPNLSRAFLRPLVATLCLTMVAGVASAAESETQERAGFISGMLVGAIVGGPPGAVIGAVGGGLAGRSAGRAQALEQRNAEIERLRAEIHQATVDAAAERREAERRDAERRTMVASAAPAVVAPPLPELALESTVQFRTGSAELESHYVAQLHALAAFAAKFQHANIHLLGHADRRGPAPANQRLSAARVKAVRATLVAGGLAAERITYKALGESEPLYEDADREGRDFERRVLIRIESHESRS